EAVALRTRVPAPHVGELDVRRAEAHRGEIRTDHGNLCEQVGDPPAVHEDVDRQHGEAERERHQSAQGEAHGRPRPGTRLVAVGGGRAIVRPLRGVRVGSVITIQEHGLLSFRLGVEDVLAARALEDGTVTQLRARRDAVGRVAPGAAHRHRRAASRRPVLRAVLTPPPIAATCSGRVRRCQLRWNAARLRCAARNTPWNRKTLTISGRTWYVSRKISTATTAFWSGTPRLTNTAVIEPSMIPRPPGTKDTSEKKRPTPNPTITSPGESGWDTPRKAAHRIPLVRTQSNVIHAVGAIMPRLRESRNSIPRSRLCW